MIHASDGKPANNLFGIKADQRWSGERASVDTLEYEGGVPVKKRAFFRAYDSLRDSFMDYVDFVKGNPRYREALESTADSDAYFTALQKAGYATDPKYAKKINAVLNGEEMSRATGRLKGMESRSL
jgi:flagellar protein FlgJ